MNELEYKLRLSLIIALAESAGECMRRADIAISPSVKEMLNAEARAQLDEADALRVELADLMAQDVAALEAKVCAS